MCVKYEPKETPLWEAIPGKPARLIKIARKDGEEENYEVTVPLAQWDYAHIVSLIIKARYDDDQREAISFNYQDDPANEEHAREMEELQEWRALAKATAHEVLGDGE